MREVAARAAPTPRDVPGLLAVVATGCRELTEAEGAVDAVGVASMAETGAPIGHDGEALTDLLRWEAGLGEEDAAELADLAPEVFARSGVRLSAKTPLLVWRWLRRERPEIWEDMSCWMGAADLVVHAFTGESVTDHTLAGRTGGYRLAASGRPPATRFDVSLLTLAGMPRDRLPRVAGPHEVAGRVSVAAAALTGLPAGTPVVVAGHDHQVAAWAAGTRESGDVADSLGTAEAVLSVLSERPDPEQVRRHGMSLVQTIAGDADALVAGSSSAGAMLTDWLATIPADRRNQILARAAEENAADRLPTGAAVAPYLRGRQTPEPDPEARAGHPPAGWSEVRQARAVVEGMCYQARWMIQTQVGQGRPRRIAVIGGDRLPRLWTALKHETLPWPTAMVRAGEPVAMGAAVLALARAGALGDPVPAVRAAPVLDVQTLAPQVGDPHASAYAAFVESVRAGLSVADGSSIRSAAVD